jgi:hypothetical protein
MSAELLFTGGGTLHSATKALLPARGRRGYGSSGRAGSGSGLQFAGPLMVGCK